jgi:uncharacterized Zn finger protein
MNWFTWGPRKSVADRRADAAREIQAAARRGQALSPVVITGRKIAQTFWGKAWCDNLERYRDFAYRLERGRSYVRSGSVVDLRIAAGEIAARVHGSSLYDVSIEIDAVGGDAWRAIQRDCAGSIGSRIELLAGKLSQPVMARLCADRTGLFPAPSAIRFTCSCPDVASMCKHVAAAMYGVGARLDQSPELLFTLRRVALDELLAAAVSELPAAPSAARVLASDGLAALFGIELADTAAPPPAKPRAAAKPRAVAVPPAPKPAAERGARPKRKPAAPPRVAAPPSPPSPRRRAALGTPSAAVIARLTAAINIAASAAARPRLTGAAARPTARAAIAAQPAAAKPAAAKPAARPAAAIDAAVKATARARARLVDAEQPAPRPRPRR